MSLDYSLPSASHTQLLLMLSCSADTLCMYARLLRPLLGGTIAVVVVVIGVVMGRRFLLGVQARYRVQLPVTRWATGQRGVRGQGAWS